MENNMFYYNARCWFTWIYKPTRLV